MFFHPLGAQTFCDIVIPFDYHELWNPIPSSPNRVSNGFFLGFHFEVAQKY